MKFNKLVLALATLTLAGCGLNNGSDEVSNSTSEPEELKQPKITAEKARELGESIFDFIDDTYEDVVIPSECTLRRNGVSHYEAVSDGVTQTMDDTTTYLAIFSEEKGIYYVESSYLQIYNDQSIYSSHKQWVFVEGDTAYAYSISEEEGEIRYGVETGDATDFDLKEMAFQNFALENADIIYDNIKDFMYSDITPTLDTDIDNIEVTFDSYYGSLNDNSLQAIEDMSASSPDYESKGVHLSTSEQSTRKIWIENYLAAYYESNSEVHQVQLGSENKMDITSEYKYKLSEVAESVPELDKSLFTE